MHYYHFTTWDLEKIETGVISTDWETSNYWQRKMETGWIVPVTNVIQENTRIDDIIEITKQIRINDVPISKAFEELKSHLITQKYCCELLKEYVFEEIRVDEFPELPSRKKCMFLFERTRRHVDYAKRYSLDLHRYKLVEIEIVNAETAKLVKANPKFLDCNLSDYSGMAQNARKYWASTETDGDYCEILFEGSFRIARAVAD